MRLEKRRRQFIFSTHNANIPVLGDAELILGLAASGEGREGHGRVAPEDMGSIDSAPVRELVDEILEGGKDAFEMRRSKYGVLAYGNADRPFGYRHEWRKLRNRIQTRRDCKL